MKFIKIKSAQVFSNGSLDFSNINFTAFKQFHFYEKDHTNFFFNKKEKFSKIKSDYSSTYKNKYLISK